MDFAAAWNAAAIGATVAVSDGQAQPSSNTDGLPYKAWRSHNFTGALAEKIEGPPRLLHFRQAPDPAGNVVGYFVSEDVAHDFTIVE